MFCAIRNPVGTGIATVRNRDTGRDRRTHFMANVCHCCDEFLFARKHRLQTIPHTDNFFLTISLRFVKHKLRKLHFSLQTSKTLFGKRRSEKSL
jgi:hypothetical protein